MATLSLGNKTIFTQSGSNDPVMSNSVQQPSGSVIQIVSQVVDEQVEYQDSDSWQEMIPMKISITPRFSGSKFLVQYSITISTSADSDPYQFCHILPYYKINTGNYNIAVRASQTPPLSNQIQGAFNFKTGDDDVMHTNFAHFIHSPSYTLMDEIHYTPFFRTGYLDTSHVYLNRTWDITANNDINGYGISTATIMEIAA